MRMKVTTIIFFSVICSPFVCAQQVVKSAIHSGANTTLVKVRQSVGQPIAPTEQNALLYGFQAPILLKVALDVAIDISIYPNPAHEIIYVETPNPNHSFTIHTLDGKLLVKDIFKEKQNQIFLGELPKGVFVLRIYDDNNNTKASAKILKE